MIIQISVFSGRCLQLMKILHVLYQSLPQLSGSSIRSRDILMSQHEAGMEALAVTSPFQAAQSRQERIHEITYHRTALRKKDAISDKPGPLIQRFFKFMKIVPFYWQLVKLIKKEKPDVLHAHAMFFCGLPAIWAGKRFNIPVVYEIRSLWMLTKSHQTGKGIRSLIEKMLFRIELYVAKRADKIVVISEGLKDEMEKAGIHSDHIEVIKNAVNTSWIEQQRMKVVEDPGENEVLVFGYIGTLTSHEGIEFLIDAFENIASAHPHCKLKIFGKGIRLEGIKSKLDLCPNATYEGALDPSEVYKAYQQVDVIVNPRHKNKLTDSVTPLKPLEAMAYEKLFLGSDVGGIQELVEDGVTGYLFKADDETDLVSKLTEIIRLDPEIAGRIKHQAKDYVMREKSWLNNAARYKTIYKELLSA